MINLESNPAPNTVIDLVSAGVTDMALLASLTITLNEQIATGDGSTMTGLTTNAIHIELTALDLEGTTGVVESDIIIGQSKSSLTAAIPEPGTLGLFAGLPLLALLRRRRQ